MKHQKINASLNANDFLTPAPNRAAPQIAASAAAATEGAAWATFATPTGRRLTLRGRQRQALAMLCDGRRAGRGVAKGKIGWNLADTVRKLAREGVQIGRIERNRPDGGTATGRGKDTAYVLLEDWAQSGELFYAEIGEQPALDLHGPGAQPPAQRLTLSEAATPFIRTGLVKKAAYIEPLKPAQGGVAKKLRAVRKAIRTRARAKREAQAANLTLNLGAA